MQLTWRSCDVRQCVDERVSEKLQLHKHTALFDFADTTVCFCFQTGPLLPPTHILKQKLDVFCATPHSVETNWAKSSRYIFVLPNFETNLPPFCTFFAKIRQSCRTTSAICMPVHTFQAACMTVPNVFDWKSWLTSRKSQAVRGISRPGVFRSFVGHWLNFFNDQKFKVIMPFSSHKKICENEEMTGTLLRYFGKTTEMSQRRKKQFSATPSAFVSSQWLALHGTTANLLLSRRRLS